MSRPGKCPSSERVNLAAAPDDVAEALMQPGILRTRDIEDHRRQRSGCRHAR